jgi:alkylation response protein AidB-like acyl-CoA dehydrogenase
MDFEFTDEQKQLRKEVRQFLEKEIAPIADERDAKGALSRQELVGYIKMLMPFGYYNGMMPEEFGGKGYSNTTMAMLIEELSRVWSGLSAAIWIASTLNGMVAALPVFRKKYLERVMAGELISCGAITEPDAGSNAAAMRTTIVRKGDHWVLNGNKTWISDGSVADVLNVLAIADPGDGTMGSAMAIVERATTPFEHRELHKIGWRAFPTAELFFKDCRVPDDHVLSGTISSGGDGRSRTAYEAMMADFEKARSTMAVLGVGVCQAAVDATIDYVKKREQFGRPIGGFQMIQEMVADMIMDTDAARFLTYRAWQRIDEGKRARLESSIAKAYACEAAVRVASRAVEIHGAMGIDENHSIHRYLRDAPSLPIPDGTTQIQKLVIGREALGIRAFHQE